MAITYRTIYSDGEAKRYRIKADGLEAVRENTNNIFDRKLRAAEARRARTIFGDMTKRTYCEG